MKKKYTYEWAHFETAKASELKDSVEFNGRTYAPDAFKAFVICEMAHSIPAVNSKRRAFTPATMANSFATAQFQLQNFQHRMERYGHDQDRICGAIVDVEFPAKKSAIATAEKGEPVPMKALIAVWRNAKGVTEMLLDMATGKADWKVSMECAFIWDDAALWDGEKFYPWSECGDDMKALVKPHTVEDWDGKKMALVMGGEDGYVIFNGNAFTEFPADKDAKISQFAASKEPQGLLLNAGWRSTEDYMQAVAQAAVRERTEQAALIIGATQAGGEDGHTHEIASNLAVLPAGDGHSHYLQVIAFDPEKGVLEGLTTGGYWDRDRERYVEHAHKVVLGSSGSGQEVSVQPPIYTEGFEMHKHVKFLKDQAAALRKKGDNDTAGSLEKEAAELETSLATETVDKKVEEVVAGRIQNGDLIPKAKHADEVAAAKKAGEEAVRKELADKEAAESARKEKVAKRMTALAEAKLDPKFQIRPDATIEKVVTEEIACNEAGDKDFERRLQEWSTIREKTGQMGIGTASEDGKSGKPKAPPHVGANGNQEAVKPGFVMV